MARQDPRVGNKGASGTLVAAAIAAGRPEIGKVNSRARYTIGEVSSTPAPALALGR